MLPAACPPRFRTDVCVTCKPVVAMSYNINKIRYAPLGDGGYHVIYDDCPIAHVVRKTSLGRAWSKSNMGTRHIKVWRASLDGVQGIDPPERLRIEQALRARDKATRRLAAEYVLDCYERTQIVLPGRLAA